MKHTAAVVALVLLSGCATTFRPWKLSEVEEGMDRAQVVHILGEPDLVETKNGAEYLHYSYREDYNPPLTIDPTDAPAANRGLQSQQRLKEYKYAVKLVDGKVQDYKELTD